MCGGIKFFDVVKGAPKQGIYMYIRGEGTRS